MKIENRVSLLELQNKLVLHDNASLQIGVQRQQERQQMMAQFQQLMQKVEAEEGIKLNPNTLQEVSNDAGELMQKVEDAGDKTEGG